jgi:F-type H+-transporting ATPase subunit gamma
MDTMENLRRKIGSAGELESVVRTMKAMAASNISQYEMAATALNDYYHTVESGLTAYFLQEKKQVSTSKNTSSTEHSICAIVFGSDQGLVGQFNDVLSQFAAKSLREFSGTKKIWAVGERIHDRLSDSGFMPKKLFLVPNSVSAITSLVGQVLVDIEANHKKGKMNEMYIFHNSPKIGSGYEPVCQRLLPLDQKWRTDLKKRKWPTNKLPQIVGETKSTLLALVREYLFVSIYRACAESLASENTSRLEAMQRAEKNIDELLDELNSKYHRLRQSSIDEELFDVVSGFEAMKK